jgi:hypothetical protein
MPSLIHDGLVELFQNRADLAVGLLRDVLHVPLPAYKEARIASADLTDIKPAARHADLVIQLTGDEPVLGIIVECSSVPMRRSVSPGRST